VSLGAQADIGDLTAQLSQEKDCSKDLREQLQGAELRANEASGDLKRCQEDLTKAKEQISELQQQVGTWLWT
jgi:septal ring factor EnvC (AmiA/AmiB activator)